MWFVCIAGAWWTDLHPWGPVRLHHVWEDLPESSTVWIKSDRYGLHLFCTHIKLENGPSPLWCGRLKLFWEVTFWEVEMCQVDIVTLTFMHSSASETSCLGEGWTLYFTSVQWMKGLFSCISWSGNSFWLLCVLVCQTAVQSTCPFYKIKKKSLDWTEVLFIWWPKHFYFTFCIHKKCSYSSRQPLI